jgi:hypothetical protein
MDAELQKYLDHHMGNIYDSINGLRSELASSRARYEEHVRREGARDIHHIPPCQAFEDHEDEVRADKQEARRNTIAVAALVAAVVGLLFKLVLGN